MADERTAEPTAEPTGVRTEGPADELSDSALDAVSGGHGISPSMAVEIAKSVIICQAPPGDAAPQ